MAPAKKTSSCLIVGGVVGGGCLLIFIIAMVAGMFSGYSEWKKKNPATPTASTKTQPTTTPPNLQRYMAALGRAYTTLSTRKTADFRLTKCDGAAMTKAAGKDPLTLLIVYGPFLKRFTTIDQPWSAGKGPWDFLSDSAFRGHFTNSPKERKAYDVEDTAKRVDDTFLPPHYLIVIWPEDEQQNVLPELTGDKKFIGGEFNGWLVVVDQTDGSIACTQRLDVRSSSEISHRTRGLFGKDAATAVKDDFERNFQKAIDTALPDRVSAMTSFGSVFH